MHTPPESSTPEAPVFRDIFDAELGYVWNALRQLGVSSDDVEDLVHEVFLTVHRRLSDYDPARPLRPWLFGICVRKAAAFRRLARHRREVSAEEVDTPDDGPMPDEELAAKQAQALARRALDALELDRRAVLVLHDLEGYAAPEVARALAIPLNTAYSRLRLARRDFAEAVARLSRDAGKRGTP